MYISCGDLNYVYNINAYWLVSTTQEAGEVLGEVRFVNSYPEYQRGEHPQRTSDHGTWHLRETVENKEHGNRIGFMSKYDYMPRRNGGREQGPNLGLREYTYYPVGVSTMISKLFTMFNSFSVLNQETSMKLSKDLQMFVILITISF